MVILKDSIEIRVPVDRLYQWLLQLEENFNEWSPYHKGFKKNGEFAIGTKIQFIEEIDGVTYNVIGKIRKIEKDEKSFSILLETPGRLAQINFIGTSSPNGCIFTHIEKFGKPNTFWGKLVNFLLFDVFNRKKANWNLILNDMKEDNLYLKNYLETGDYGHIKEDKSPLL
ncbi:MAG: SRPBCC family protein [Tissierellia bacterium]|nr:SRPBCC family protein [Tissierellia bacterium]